MIRLGNRFRGQSAGRASARDVSVTPDPATDDGNVFLFHQDPGTADRLVEEARTLGNTSSTELTLLVGAVPETSEPLWEGFATVLGDSRRTGIQRVLLVMAGAALERGGRPAVAARMRDEWEVEVVAPAGRPLMVPGGHLFATEEPDTSDGADGLGGPASWWRFAPGAKPRPLGPRYPVPRWQNALNRLDADLARGHLLEEIPAGLLIRNAGASSADAQGIRHSVPVDADRPCVLVGTPGAPDVSAEALATVLAALPAPVRQTVRLVPGAGDDLLPTARATADLLGAATEVTTGLPVLMEGDTSDGQDQVVVMASDGNPAWQPYVGSVVCPPNGGAGSPGPRLGRWRSPVAGLERETDEGVLRFEEGWRLAVTRAGLWLGPAGFPRPPFWERPVHADVVAIDLDLPGRHLDDTARSALDRLLGALESASRRRAEIHVRGEVDAEGLSTLRRLAVRHGVAVVTRSADTAPPGTEAGEPPVAPAHPEAAVPPVAPALWEYQPGPLPHRSSGDAVPPAGSARVPEEPAPGRETPAATVERPTAPARTPGYALESAGEPALAPAAGPSAGDRLLGALPDPAVPAAPEPGGSSPAAASAPAPVPAPATGGAGPFAPPSPSPSPSLSPSPEAEAEAGPGVRSASGSGSAAPSQAPAAVTSPPAGPRSGSDPAPSSPPAPVPGERTGPRQDGPAADPGPPVPTAPAPGAGHGRRTAVPSPLGFPVAPTYRSTPADREALRRLVGAQWDQHSAALTRALSRLPALRVQAQKEDARADLIAVRAYLTVEDGPLSDQWIEQGFTAGDRSVLPSVACAASGLRRLPSHRGPAIRSAGPDGRAVDGLEPGHELCRAGPLSALVLDGAVPSAATDRYLIWSVVGRRVRPLLEQPTESDHPEEIVFGPATRFRVLGVEDAGESRLVLLRELGPNTPPGRPGRAPDSQDEAIALRLREAARTLESVSRAGTEWPRRCTGALLPRNGDDRA